MRTAVKPSEANYVGIHAAICLNFFAMLLGIVAFVLKGDVTCLWAGLGCLILGLSIKPMFALLDYWWEKSE